jgi:carbamoyl-phosphate synthase small subunit
MEDAYLVLNNGLCFKGRRIGSPVDSIGELVFTTGMVGYLETLTDPSYAGQIVLQTFPLIGNYGVIEEDFEGESFVRGYIVREMCDTPSNFRSEYALDRFLKVVAARQNISVAKRIEILCAHGTEEGLELGFVILA